MKNLEHKSTLARADNIHMEFKPPIAIAEELSNLFETISLHRHLFVDDHAEIHCFNNLAEITELISPILDLQVDWGFTTNMDKSFALLKVQGRGCKNQIKNMANKIKLEKHGYIKVTPSSKYLGVILNADGNMNEEISQRIKKANQAMQNLGKYGDRTNLPDK